MTDTDPVGSTRDVRVAPRFGWLSRAMRGLGVVLGWHILVVAAYLLWAFLQSPQHSPDSCDGLGWGCTPNPRDGALLVGIFYGAPAVSVMVVVSAVLTAAFAFRLRSGWRAGIVGTLITWLVATGPLLVWYRNPS